MIAFTYAHKETGQNRMSHSSPSRSPSGYGYVVKSLDYVVKSLDSLLRYTEVVSIL